MNLINIMIECWQKWLERAPDEACEVLKGIEAARTTLSEEELSEAFWEVYELAQRTCVENLGWAEYLARWRKLQDSADGGVPYDRIWRKYQEASLRLGDAPRAVQEYWAQLYEACRQERADLSSAAYRAYNDERTPVEAKRQAFEAALDKRLYPSLHVIAGGERYQEALKVEDEKHTYAELEAKRRTLDDPYARVVVEAELHRLEQEIEMLDLRYMPQEAYEWVRETQALVEGWLRATRREAAEELQDLEEKLRTFLKEIHKKREEVYERITLDSESRILWRAWGSEIKKYEALRDSGEADASTREGAEKELETLQREYAEFALRQGNLRFGRATGRTLQDWRDGEHQLNPSKQLSEVLKDIKVALIDMQPQTYMKRFPEVRVEGDRSRDPNPIHLNTEVRDRFHAVLEGLEEALAVAEEVEALEREWAKSDTRRRLELVYRLEELHPTKQRQKTRAELEKLILGDMRARLECLVKEVAFRLGLPETTIEAVQELKKRFSGLHDELESLPLAQHLAELDEATRESFEQLWREIGAWEELLESAFEARRALQKTLAGLEAQLQQEKVDLDALDKRYEQTRARVERLSKEEGYRRWVLSDDLRERLDKIGKRLEARRNDGKSSHSSE